MLSTLVGERILRPVERDARARGRALRDLPRRPRGAGARSGARGTRRTGVERERRSAPPPAPARGHDRARSSRCAHGVLVAVYAFDQRSEARQTRGRMDRRSWRSQAPSPRPRQLQRCRRSPSRPRAQAKGRSVRARAFRLRAVSRWGADVVAVDFARTRPLGSRRPETAALVSARTSRPGERFAHGGPIAGAGIDRGRKAAFTVGRDGHRSCGRCGPAVIGIARSESGERRRPPSRRARARTARPSTTT